MRVRPIAPIGTAPAATIALGPIGPARAGGDDGLPLDTPLMLNVDRDAELETIRIREVTCYVDGEEAPPPCEGDFPNRDIQIELVNQCNGVEQVTPLLVRTENFVTVAEPVESTAGAAASSSSVRPAGIGTRLPDGRRARA